MSIPHHFLNALLLLLDVLLEALGLTVRRLGLLLGQFLMDLQVEAVQNVTHIENLDKKILRVMLDLLVLHGSGIFGLLDEAADEATAGHRAETYVLYAV